jgi:hypothetical protein
VSGQHSYAKLNGLDEKKPEISYFYYLFRIPIHVIWDQKIHLIRIRESYSNSYKHELCIIW